MMVMPYVIFQTRLNLNPAFVFTKDIQQNKSTRKFVGYKACFNVWQSRGLNSSRQRVSIHSKKLMNI